MNTEIRKRYTAYKVSIGLIASGVPQFVKDAEDPSKELFKFLSLAGKEINRINLIANVIDKYQNEGKTFMSLTIDDGSGNIRIKVFSDSIALLEPFELGDTIKVIGTLRYFNNELYILPNIVRQIDARWLLVRKLELEKEYGKLYISQEKADNLKENMLIQEKEAKSQNTSEEQAKEEEIVPVEKIVDEEKIADNPEKNEEVEKNAEPGLREQVFGLIKTAEAEEGIDIDKMIMKLSQPVDDINKIITELLEEGAIFEPRPGRLRIL